MSKQPKSPSEILEQWIERDLTQAAAADQLAPAFEVNEPIRLIADVMAVGRSPVIVGESGVGKTAMIHEFVRRQSRGDCPASLRGKRVLQFSLRQRISSLRKSEDIKPALDQLSRALSQVGREVIPVFRDWHLGFQFDVEGQFQTLAMRHGLPLLCEGEAETVSRMIEYSPELEHFFTVIRLSEPDADRMNRILRQWASDRSGRGGRAIEPTAVDEALNLAHRFLSRQRFPRKAIDLLTHALAAGPRDRPLSAAEVIERFTTQHRVPQVLIDPTRRLDIAALEREFSTGLLGQEEAVSAMTRMIAQIKAGLSDMRRPFGVFMFVGPTGVGKTHLAQMLAAYLFGSRERLIRLNMADYQTESQAEVLFGDPHGSASQRCGVLTSRVAGQPFAVLLLDEFEKSHAKVIDRFMQLMDEGEFINGAGETVSCRSMIIIATSNAGAEAYRGQPFGFAGAADLARRNQEVDRRIHEVFRVEFLNRFDAIVHFHPLTREHIRAVALRELEHLSDRYGIRQRNLTLEFNDSVLDWLTVHGYDPDFGARFLRRTIERHVVNALAEWIVREQPPAGSRVELLIRRNQVEARRVIEARSPPPRETISLPVGSATRPRRVDAAAVRAEALRIVEAARARLALLDDRRQERELLLARMNEPAFWDPSPERSAVLDRFRELDVLIRMEGRFSGPISELARRCAEPDAGATGASGLAAQVEAAAMALRDWEDRAADEGVQAIWLVLSGADPARPPGKWLIELAQIQLAWARRVHLLATPVGFCGSAEQPTHIALAIEGSGAQRYFAMEEGQHRRHRPAGPPLRARVRIVPRSGADLPTGRGNTVKRVKPRSGPLRMRAEHCGRIEVESRGIAHDWYAAHADLLAHFLTDLTTAWMSSSCDDATLVRVYAESGIAARDPRTQGVLPKWKSVSDGHLDVFLDAFRNWRGATAAID